MGADYDQVVAAIPRLSPDERAKIVDRLRAFQSLAPGQTPASAVGAFEPQAAGGVDELLAAISAVVLRMSGEKVSPAGLRRTPQHRALAEKAGALLEFVSKHAPDRARRRALLELGLGLLYRDLSRAGFAPTARVLMRCAHQVPAALDKSFPGYASSGLLGMVVGRSSSP